MPRGIERFDARQNLLAEAHLLHAIAVGCQDAACCVTAPTGCALPVSPLGTGNVEFGFREDSLAIPIQQSTDMITVHVRDENRIHLLRCNPLLAQTLNSFANTAAIACIDQDRTAISLKQEGIDGSPGFATACEPDKLLLRQ